MHFAQDGHTLDLAEWQHRYGVGVHYTDRKNPSETKFLARRGVYKVGLVGATECLADIEHRSEEVEQIAS